jgi:hypothetical protein
MGVVIAVPGPRAESFLYSGAAFREIAAGTAEALTHPEDRDELERAQLYQLLDFG